MGKKRAVRIAEFVRRHPVLKAAAYPAIAVRRLSQRKNKRIQQRIYENLLHMAVHDPCMRVPQFRGEFTMDVRSDIFKRLLFSGQYESELVEVCEKYVDPRRDVIDAGANIGFFSVLFAKAVSQNRKKVLAIEPTTNALKYLHQNLQKNGVDDHVIVYEGVVSETAGELAMTVVLGKEEYSSLSSTKHPSITGKEGQEYSYSSQKVQAETIDQLVKQHSLDPGFMKVDVEGAEHLVFKGARDLLEKNRPIILSELNEYMLVRNGSSTSDVVRFFQDFDYEVLDPTALGRPFKGKAFGDMLCVPR